ncbi:hypothetical protein BKA81DRAFT_372266 [Phyllosticta paracitricarpa]
MCIHVSFQVPSRASVERLWPPNGGGVPAAKAGVRLAHCAGVVVHGSNKRSNVTASQQFSGASPAGRMLFSLSNGGVKGWRSAIVDRRALGGSERSAAPVYMLQNTLLDSGERSVEGLQCNHR